MGRWPLHRRPKSAEALGIEKGGEGKSIFPRLRTKRFACCSASAASRTRRWVRSSSPLQLVAYKPSGALFSFAKPTVSTTLSKPGKGELTGPRSPRRMCRARARFLLACPVDFQADSVAVRWCVVRKSAVSAGRAGGYTQYEHAGL